MNLALFIKNLVEWEGSRGVDGWKVRVQLFTKWFWIARALIRCIEGSQLKIDIIVNNLLIWLVDLDPRTCSILFSVFDF